MKRGDQEGSLNFNTAAETAWYCAILGVEQQMTAKEQKTAVLATAAHTREKLADIALQGLSNVLLRKTIHETAILL